VVTRRQFDYHSIPNEQPDEILVRSAADVRRNAAPVDFHPIQSARQLRLDRPLGQPRLSAH